MAGSLTLTVAAGDYLHTLALRDGEERDGLRLRYVAVPPSVAFRRMLDEEAWDVAEMSLATTYMLADRGDRRFVALPVFLSRVFRHSAIYVAPAIERPEDLRGRDAGVLRYAMTMAVWVRALLAEHGVTAPDMRWWLGEATPYPADLPVGAVGGGVEALERLAEAGTIQALLSAHVPRAFRSGGWRRLFPDFAAREREYHARTGIVPIMHVAVVRRRLVDEHAGLVGRLLARFEEARDRAERALLDTAVSVCPLPWLSTFAEETRARLGGELWPYGVAANAATLGAFGRAMAEQRLTRRALDAAEVFVSA